MKIGRNDLCPCNSGKKYKKCCIGKETSQPSPNKGFKKYEYLSLVDTLSLVKSFAGLTLLPQNHGKYFRLEQLMILAFLHKHEGVTPITSTGLTEFLTTHFKSESLEDEPTCAFTDLVTFDGGDAIIFPGIDADAARVLSNLLAGIYHWDPSVLPLEFKGNVYHVARLILAISDTIAKKLRYGRYMMGKSDSDLIDVPEDNILYMLRQAVTFSKSEMEKILAENDIHPQAIENLLIDPSRINASWLNPEMDKICNTPIYFTGNDYIVLHPPVLATTLINFIWNEAEEYKCTRVVATIFNDFTWNDTRKNLGILQFQPIENEQLLENGSSRHILLSIDVDKIAYVNFFGDERNEKPFSPQAYLQRWQQVYESLQSSAKYKHSQILVINVVGSNGRPIAVPMMKAPHALTLSIPAFEINILAELHDVNALHLWKYAASVEQLQMPGMPIFSFLDGFKFYRDQHHSFTIHKTHMPILLPGYSSDWMMEALHQADRHSIIRPENGEHYFIPTVRREKYAPVYINEMELLAQELHFAVDIGKVPIWVSTEKMPERLDGGLKNAYWLFTDAIAYWIWQMQFEIMAILSQMDMTAIRVQFSFDDPSIFASIHQDYGKRGDLNENFTIFSNIDGFSIVIPQQIIPYLYGADNEGERILVKNLLKGINLLLQNNNKAEITDDTINSIADKIAPLSNKKKVFVFDVSNNILMAPNNLKPQRVIQTHDVSHVNSQINISKLPDFSYQGVITDKTDKLKIINGVVHKLLLPLLKEKLANLDYESLLKRLIGLNESLINKREETYLVTPTRIACYVGVEQHLIDTAERINENSRTNVAIRCLIEHIAAERYQGASIISNTTVDELIAIMDRIIFWGGTSDQVNFNLLNANVEIAEDGTIRLVDNEAHNTLTNYHRQKTGEDIIDAISDFEYAFPSNDDQQAGSIPPALENAFLQDVGISLTGISDFLSCMTLIGLKQNTDYGVCTLKDLRELINSIAPEGIIFEVDEFEAALNFLSLRERGDIIKLPIGGYVFTDISPWRYNRALSLLRKPLIVTGEPGNEMVYWGARQCVQSKVTIAAQIISDRFRTLPGQENIKSAMGIFARERGDRLVAAIVKAIQKDKPENVQIFIEQFISPSGAIKNAKDIGDVDVLVIDPNKKAIYSIESKAISSSRSIKEMVEEVDKLMNVKDGWIPKHMRRDQWIKENLQKLSAVYKIDITTYSVKSIFVTEEDALTSHLEAIKLPLPLLTRYKLENKGFPILEICE